MTYHPVQYYEHQFFPHIIGEWQGMDVCRIARTMSDDHTRQYVARDMYGTAFVYGPSVSYCKDVFDRKWNKETVQGLSHLEEK